MIRAYLVASKIYFQKALEGVLELSQTRYNGSHRYNNFDILTTPVKVLIVRPRSQGQVSLVYWLLHILV